MLRAISARDIAVSGLRAQRTRMNVIANNIANAETTRTPGGGAFRRQLTIFRGNPIRRWSEPEQVGVKVKAIRPDEKPFRVVYDPEHPDANNEGYVEYPNINIAAEMVDLIAAQRAYEANIAVLASGAQMRQRAVEIIQQ